MRKIIEGISSKIRRWLEHRNTVNDVMTSIYDELSGFTAFRRNNVMKACNQTTYIEYRLLETEKDIRKAVEHFSAEKYGSMAQELCFIFFIVPAEMMENNHYKHKIPVGWGTFTLGGEKPTWVVAAPNIKDYTNKQK